MKKKVMITSGGTGGHIFPAMALAEQLEPHAEVVFIGGGLSKNRYFHKEMFPYKDVSCGNVSFKKPFKSLVSFGNIIKGIWTSRQLIKQWKPDIVVGFGSYYTLPTILAAKICGIPIVLHEANRIPGRVNRLLSNHVALTGVHFPDTAFQLKGKSLEIPIPLRKEYKKDRMSLYDARAYFGLLPECSTFLIFGGSQGAQAINRLSSEALLLCEKEGFSFQVIHITGCDATAKELQAGYSKAGIRSCVKAFENHMHLAWQAADFMISRSGAGTVAEQLEFEVPGVLIPFPQAMDNHQESNADFMAYIIGGGIKCREGELTVSLLKEEIISAFAHDEEQLKEMRHRMRKFNMQRNSKQLAHVILEMIK